MTNGSEEIGRTTDKMAWEEAERCWETLRSTKFGFHLQGRDREPHWGGGGDLHKDSMGQRKRAWTGVKKPNRV